MTAPISVDPSALAATGATVAGDGDWISAAIGSLESALSGAGAMFGHDAAGVVFAQGYSASGSAILDAAAKAVDACRRVGFGVQMSAANYGRANASSTVGGGTSPVPVPTAPGKFSAPGMPPAFGAGIAAPMGWALVEGFVGDVWPDGNPGELRAVAGAWRSFGAAMSALVGQVNAEGPGLGAQQIPEAGQMVDAVGEIAGGLGDIASETKTLATSIEGFADAVDSTQNAVRGLLDQLSLSGVLETIGGIFTGHNPIDKVREVADEIKTVLENMKREADASNTLFSQGINMLDAATSSLQKWADKEFTEALGQEVGGALSAAFNWEVDTSEGGLKFVAETVHGLGQLDPTRFAYDPSGAAETWHGMLESAAVVTNPALLASTIAADPQGSLDTLKSVTDWKDVEAGHPGRAVGYDAAQIGSLFIPGLGEAEPAIDGAGVAGRAASAEERAAAGAAQDGVPGLSAASSASENIATRAGRVGSELDGIKVPESAPPGAAPGASAPTGRAPVEAPRPEAPAPRAAESAPGPHAPEPSSAPASDSAPAAAPQSAEPSRAHADPPPSHSLEPAHVSAPTEPASSPVLSRLANDLPAPPDSRAPSIGQESEPAGHPADSLTEPAQSSSSGEPPHPSNGHGDSHLDPNSHGGSGSDPHHGDRGTDNPGTHNPPHTGLYDPPANHGVPGERLPDLSVINHEYRLPDGSIDSDRMREWADRVSDAYPTISSDGVEGVYDYTTEKYQGMNPYLRDIDPLSPSQQSMLEAHSLSDMSPTQRAAWEAQISHTDDGLSSLPPYRADPLDPTSTTWRGMQASDSLLSQMNVGDTFSDPAYYSTSTDPVVAEEFARGAGPDMTPTLITVIGLDGVDVAPLSRYATEAEILFPRSSEFEVVFREMCPDGLLRITLKQITP